MNKHMCIICTNEYTPDTTYIHCCNDVHEIPETLTSLTHLSCTGNTNITSIPPTLVALQRFSGSMSMIKTVPGTCVNLEIIECFDSEFEIIPDTLVNLTLLYIPKSRVKIIPDTLVNLVHLQCYDNPQLRTLPETLIHLTDLYCDHLLVPNTIPASGVPKYNCTTIRKFQKHCIKRRIKRLTMLQTLHQDLIDHLIEPMSHVRSS
jgi:hypothetical protein